jgi:hypothetical protein
MVNLNGHEAGNGGYSQGTPTARRAFLYSETAGKLAAMHPSGNVVWHRVVDRLPLLTNSAFPAFFGAVPTIFAVLAGMTRIGTSARCREDIDLTDQKKGQHDLS